MTQRKPRIPSYRHHKARDCAVVTINGKNHYLGRWQSPESKELYDRLIGEWLAHKRVSWSPIEEQSRRVGAGTTELPKHLPGSLKNCSSGG